MTDDGNHTLVESYRKYLDSKYFHWVRNRIELNCDKNKYHAKLLNTQCCQLPKLIEMLEYRLLSISL